MKHTDPDGRFDIEELKNVMFDKINPRIDSAVSGFSHRAVVNKVWAILSRRSFRNFMLIRSKIAEGYGRSQ